MTLFWSVFFAFFYLIGNLSVEAFDLPASENIVIEGDEIELALNQNIGYVRSLTKKSKVTQKKKQELHTVQASKFTIFFEEKKDAKIKNQNTPKDPDAAKDIRAIDAEGGVIYVKTDPSQKKFRLTADFCRYEKVPENKEEKLTCHGNVKIEDGENVVTGDVSEFFLNSKIYRVRKTGDKQTRSVFVFPLKKK